MSQPETTKITDAELEELRKCNASRNYEQFEAVCCDIKARRDGSYPEDWHEKVNMTGIIDDVRPRGLDVIWIPPPE